MAWGRKGELVEQLLFIGQMKRTSQYHVRSRACFYSCSTSLCIPGAQHSSLPYCDIRLSLYQQRTSVFYIYSILHSISLCSPKPLGLMHTIVLLNTLPGRRKAVAKTLVSHVFFSTSKTWAFIHFIGQILIYSGH